MQIAMSHQALPPIHSPHNSKYKTSPPLTLQSSDNQQCLPTPSQAHNPAITISTYRKNTKNAPHKRHLSHLPSRNPPQVQAKAGEKAPQATGTPSPIPHHPAVTSTMLQSHPLVRHAAMRNRRHPTTVDRCYYTHTHTHKYTPLPFTPRLSTLENLLHTFHIETNPPIHLPGICCLLTCMSNPFSTELLFLGGSPSPAFSCPLEDLRGIWLEYNGFVTSTLFPNFR